MYLYFDKTGTLKEIINDEALRQGNYGINKLYIYVDERTVESIEASYLLHSGRIVAPESFDDVETTTIPFDRKRDLRFFKYFTEYPFIVVDLDKEVDENNNITRPGALDEAGVVHASLIAYLDGGAQLVLGGLNFEVQEDSTYNTKYVASEEYLSLADYTYLKSVIYDGLDTKWTKFVGTTEERLAATKNTSTLYVDTTTGLDYIWNGSSFVSLGERNILTFDVGNDNHINSIYYKSNSSEGTYYPTRLVSFEYIAADEKAIPISALISLNLPYNTNYLYYNTYNKQLYYYVSGSASLMLIGALQNLFSLTWDTDGYVITNNQRVTILNTIQSKATNFIIFEFNGGDYDGRRYLMNYHNATSSSYNLVCVDFEIDTETGKVSQFEKFKITISTTLGSVKGTWIEVASDNVSAVDSDTFIIGSTTYNIPSDVSDLNNDAGYLNASSSTITSMQSDISGKQDTLIPGANITLINNQISATDTTYESKEAVNGGTDLSLVTTGEKYTWNNKQNPLPSTSGNNNKYLHINDTTGNLEWSEVGFITGAFTYIGTTTTPLSDGSTTNPITIGGESVTATNGNVVFYGDAEYVWTGSAWEELGNKNQATSSVLGNIKLGSDTTIDNTSSKVYPIQLNSSGQAFVYVPWTDNNTTYNVATGSVAGLVKSSTTGTTVNRDYVVQVNNDGTMKVNVPWTDTIELFWCSSTTTYTEVTNALSAGKLPVFKSGIGVTYIYARSLGGYHYFYYYNPNDGTIEYISVNLSNNSWSGSGFQIQSKSNLKTSLSSSSTDTQYPSAKCVYDNLLLKQNTLTTSSVTDGTINKSIGFDSQGNIVKGAISSSSVNTGTIETAIGFNNNGELVKGSIPSGVDNISIVNALPSTSNAQNNILYKLNNDLYALTETEQVAPVISYSNGTLTAVVDYDAESIELYADDTLIDTILINGGNN